MPISTNGNPHREIEKDGRTVSVPWCLPCGEREAVHVALVPILNPDGTVRWLPHEYSVCAPCYDRQRRVVYPQEYAAEPAA